jgi:predicted GIY-YIG superfamily endonuclease
MEGVETEDGRTALYRFYDSDDDLIYVGITSDPEVRFAQHAADKAWWPDVVRRDVIWYGRRADALAAEEAAIKKHVPCHNKQHSPDWHMVPVTVEITETIDSALKLFIKALGMSKTLTLAQSKDMVLFCLLERELTARGLMGDPPCFHSSIAWPDGVEVSEAGNLCTCGRILSKQCSPFGAPGRLPS